MLVRALKMAFWVTYDHVGKLILANLVWSVVFFLPAGCAAIALAQGPLPIQVCVGIPLALLSFGIIVPAGAVGVAHMAKGLIERHDGSLADFFVGIRTYGIRAIFVGFFYLFAVLALSVSAWFYAAKLKDTVPWLGYGLSAIALWALLFVVLTLPLAMPALVQKKQGVLETLKLAALLTLDNPGLALGIMVQLLALSALMPLVPPLFFIFYGSVAVVLASSAYEMLARKYAAIQAAKQATPDNAAQTGAAAGSLADQEDDYLNRGIRDFLFPWKG